MSIELAVWNLLHDGDIVDVQGKVPGDVMVAVEIDYLRSMFPEPGDRFLIRLAGCSLFEFRRFVDDLVIVGDLSTVAAEEPEILSAELQEDAVVISLEGRARTYLQLRLRYENVSVSWETGKPVSMEELRDAVRDYWGRFSKDRGRGE